MELGRKINSGIFSSDKNGSLLQFPLKYANRHLVVAGQTGSGKTITLKTLVEGFSRERIPCIVTDVKGDIVDSLPEEGQNYKALPVCLWDVFAEKGLPLRVSLEELGTLLIARMLDLNKTQSSAISSAFDVLDEFGTKAKSLDILSKAVNYLGTWAYKNSEKKFGVVSTATAGVLLRQIYELKRNGGEELFNETTFELKKVLKTKNGKGLVNIIHGTKLVRFPTLYTTFIIYILNKLYTELPEVGNEEKPKCVVVIDEAHLLFRGAEKKLIEKVEEIIKLLRSKGVAVILATQDPLDIPEGILGQIANKIIHNLSGFTSKAQAQAKTIAKSFNCDGTISPLDEITRLGTGEALISFLGENGIPENVAKVKINYPAYKFIG